MRRLKQAFYFLTGVHGKVPQRRLWILALVCTAWLWFGWLSVRTGLFEGILWRPGQAADLLPATNGLTQGASTVQPAKQSVTLTGFTPSLQTLNNCGPAVLAMDFSYFGTTVDQQTVAKTLRPNADDENVRADELASYAIAQGYQAKLQVNGNADQLRLFLSNGIPVIIETWESDDLSNLADGFAHFRLVTGYNDATQNWIVYDSYVVRDLVNPQGTYQGMYVSYTQADQLWRIMNRKYVVIYTAEQAPIVEGILGDKLNTQTMWQQSLAQAQTEIDQHPDDAFAWFNYGSSLYATNRSGEAVIAFQKAETIGLPTRMFWYQYEPLEADYATGRYTDLINLADANLTSATGIEELYYWKALALVALNDPAQARQALEQALSIKPNYQQALITLRSGVGG